MTNTSDKSTHYTDNESYWVDRHNVKSGHITSVGDAGRSEEDNISLYAKKKKIVDILRELDCLTTINKMNILDAGCGIGMLSELFYALGANVSGVDVSDSAIERARLRAPGGNFLVSSLTSFSFGEAAFDVVVCADVLYHVVQDSNWMDSVNRLIAHTTPGGLVILIDQFKPEPQRPAPHVRFRTKRMYAGVIGSAGGVEVSLPTHNDVLVFRVSEGGRR